MLKDWEAFSSELRAVQVALADQLPGNAKFTNGTSQHRLFSTRLKDVGANIVELAPNVGCAAVLWHALIHGYANRGLCGAICVVDDSLRAPGVEDLLFQGFATRDEDAPAECRDILWVEKPSKTRREIQMCDAKASYRRRNVIENDISRNNDQRHCD
ncbi:hypothetical protein HYQ46_011544 [Verticillium longisporum]|nr:hypothetical protein HYQ46_011544 [Verticillium longisporum]